MLWILTLNILILIINYLSGISVSSTTDLRSNENDKMEQTSAVKCVSTSIFYVLRLL